MKNAQVKWLKSNDWYSFYLKIQGLTQEEKNLIYITEDNINNMTWNQYCNWYQKKHTDEELSSLFKVSIEQVEHAKECAKNHFIYAV